MGGFNYSLDYSKNEMGNPLSVVSSMAQIDALTKLLIEKGLITEAEFMQKLSAERAGYQAMLQRIK